MENLQAINGVKGREKLPEPTTIDVPLQLVRPGTHVRVIDGEIATLVEGRFQLGNPVRLNAPAFRIALARQFPVGVLPKPGLPSARPKKSD